MACLVCLWAGMCLTAHACVPAPPVREPFPVVPPGLWECAAEQARPFAHVGAHGRRPDAVYAYGNGIHPDIVNATVLSLVTNETWLAVRQ